jgi:hypothetical protein
MIRKSVWRFSEMIMLDQEQACANHDSRHAFSIPQRVLPEFFKCVGPLETEGAGNAG